MQSLKDRNEKGDRAEEDIDEATTCKLGPVRGFQCAGASANCWKHPRQTSKLKVHTPDEGGRRVLPGSFLSSGRLFGELLLKGKEPYRV